MLVKTTKCDRLNAENILTFVEKRANLQVHCVFTIPVLAFPLFFVRFTFIEEYSQT